MTHYMRSVYMIAVSNDVRIKTQRHDNCVTIFTITYSNPIFSYYEEIRHDR